MFSALRPIARSVLALAVILALNTLIGQPLPNGQIVLMYVIINVVCIGLPRMQRRKASERDGWRVLAPGVGEWFVIALLLSLTGLFLYVFYFVGSSRPDAATQMFWLQVLIVAFTAMSALAAWSMFASFTRWNVEGVEQDTIFIGRRAVRFDDIVAWQGEDWSGNCYIVAADGTRMRIPAMHNGVRQLFEELARRNGAVISQHEGAGDGSAPA
jgi:hypothetical protein